MLLGRESTRTKVGRDGVQPSRPKQKEGTADAVYRQFGVNPARATDQGTVDNFRRDCLRELQKIKRSWPDLHYRTVKGALLLSPSPPVIAQSQLRLVDAG